MPRGSISGRGVEGRPWATVETENLAGVLEATVCDPSRSGPPPDLLTASHAKTPAAPAGDRTAVFTPSLVGLRVPHRPCPTPHPWCGVGPTDAAAREHRPRTRDQRRRRALQG